MHSISRQEVIEGTKPAKRAKECILFFHSCGDGNTKYPRKTVVFSRPLHFDRCNATFSYCHEMSSVGHLSSVTRVYCCQMVSWIRMPLGMQVGLGPGHIVLDGDPALPPPKGHSPQFWAHICCGQMAAWIKM